VLGDLHLAEVVQSDYSGTSPQDLTYLVLLAGVMEELVPYTPTAESAARLILSEEEFLTHYRAGETAAMRRSLNLAHRVLFGDG